MLQQLHRSLVAPIVVAAFGAHAASASTLNDHFLGDAGAAPDPAVWATSATNGSATMTLDGASNLVLNAGIASASQRGLVVTQASNFDPFSAPLVIELSNVAVGGDLGDGVWNGGYVLLGRSSTNANAQYIPNGGTMAYGVSVLIQKMGSAYRLHVNEFSDDDDDSNPTDGTVLYADHHLDGAPTGLTLVIDGSNRLLSMEVAGTTFTATGTASATQALTTHFTAENLSVDGSLLSRVALGAINGGGVGSPTTFTLDAINVAPIPEPASVGLMLTGLLLVARRRC